MRTLVAAVDVFCAEANAGASKADMHTSKGHAQAKAEPLSDLRGVVFVCAGVMGVWLRLGWESSRVLAVKKGGKGGKWS